MSSEAGRIYVRRGQTGRGGSLRIQILSANADLSGCFLRILHPPTAPALRCWNMSVAKLRRVFTESRDVDRPEEAPGPLLSRADLRLLVLDLGLVHECGARCKLCRTLCR